MAPIRLAGEIGCVHAHSFSFRSHNSSCRRPQFLTIEVAEIAASRAEVVLMLCVIALTILHSLAQRAAVIWDCPLQLRRSPSPHRLFAEERLAVENNILVCG